MFLSAEPAQVDDLRDACASSLSGNDACRLTVLPLEVARTERVDEVVDDVAAGDDAEPAPARLGRLDSPRHQKHTLTCSKPPDSSTRSVDSQPGRSVTGRPPHGSAQRRPPGR